MTRVARVALELLALTSRRHHQPPMPPRNISAHFIPFKGTKLATRFPLWFFAATHRARSAAVISQQPQRQCCMRLLLVALLLASCAATYPAKDDDDAEWGIFTALRNAQSADGTSRGGCSCCHDVQDLRARVAALERDFAQITGQVSKPTIASPCPSTPAFADASAAAESAAPALARLQRVYCSEWVRF
jgi:hypothetical protein